MDALSIFINSIFFILLFIVISFVGIKAYATIVHVNVTTKPVKRDQSIDNRQVSFLHFDLYLRPYFLHPFINEYNNERINDFIEQIGDFDIVSINEAHCSHITDINSFVVRMKKNGYEHVVGLPYVNYSDLELIDGGVLLFSKLPILDNDYVKWQLSCGQDMFLAKGAVYAMVQISPTKHLHVVSANLQSLTENSVPESQSVRMNQIREIVRMLSKHVTDGAPIIIMGTFNIDALNNQLIPPMKHTEYERIWLNLNIKDYDTVTDLLFDHNHSHPPTYGVGEKYLIDKRDVGKSMANDYIFYLGTSRQTFGLVSHETETLEIPAKSGRYPYMNLSPHLAVRSRMYFDERMGV